MDQDERQAHWDGVYQRKADTEVSWFEESPDLSLRLIRALAPAAAASVVDIGGGASRLVDSLLSEGVAITVLDISEAALKAAQARLGDRAKAAKWIAADVTRWHPDAAYDVWHDRATFHFLTDPADQAAYVATLKRALRPGGGTVIATFAPDGPERCSGLPVARHDAASIGSLLGREFVLVETLRYGHTTPAGIMQQFQFSSFRRRA
jgi:trans-aconitate methyltransferase